MTILVQQQALLRVTEPLATPPPSSLVSDALSSHRQQHGTEYHNNEEASHYDENSSKKFALSSSYDDDVTVSTCSLLSDSVDADDLDDLDVDRRVSFAEDLVTETWTRPRTCTDNVGELFYSADDIQR
jgi:hypothetical protein